MASCRWNHEWNSFLVSPLDSHTCQSSLPPLAPITALPLYTNIERWLLNFAMADIIEGDS